MKPNPKSTLILQRVFQPADRTTDNLEQFLRRWRRTGEATNFTEAES